MGLLDRYSRAIGVLLLLVALGWGALYVTYLRYPHPTVAQRLQSDWRTLTNSSVFTAQPDEAPSDAAALSAFAAEVGSLNVPAPDVDDQHRLIRSAVALAADYGDSRYEPPQAASSFCLSGNAGLSGNSGLSDACTPIPATRAWLLTPAGFAADSSSFQNAAATLFSDLGLQAP